VDDFIGTSFMPHFGHLPGLSRTTSGCITQVYFRWVAVLGGGEGVSARAEAVANIATVIKNWKRWFFKAVIGCQNGGLPPRYLGGGLK